ncbi:response regulator [Parasedimentitalea marina]|nr:response regulator [Parasedimentitalea marina]
MRIADQTGLDFLIHEAAEPEEFGRALDQDKYDVIFVDLSLPGVSGLNLLPVVRNHSVNSNAAMIMIAGDGQAEVALEAVRSGFADYIEKDRLSTASLERATLNALQKRTLSNVAHKAEADTKSMEALLKKFSEACSQEMRPMLTRMMRHVRQLRAENPEGCISSTNMTQIENTCARMDEFLQDLASLADEGNLSSVLSNTTPVQTVALRQIPPDVEVALDHKEIIRPKASGHTKGWDLVQQSKKRPSLFRRKT